MQLCYGVFPPDYLFIAFFFDVKLPPMGHMVYDRLIRTSGFPETKTNKKPKGHSLGFCKCNRNGRSAEHALTLWCRSCRKCIKFDNSLRSGRRGFDVST